MENFNLEEYLSKGVTRIVKGILGASLKYPRAGLFMTKYLVHSRTAQKKRRDAEENGEHIPPFLIASITNQCNLHCKGCYARANHSCEDICNEKASADRLLTASEWDRIFTEAEDLGIEFILLAGGEPFVRKDVIEQAGKHPNLLFPIFTNGTMITDGMLNLLDQNRNLYPVISIEGNRQTTDERRGAGIYEKLQLTMEKLQDKGIVFGASVTVTSKNLQEVLDLCFVKKLADAGTKAIIYVEYVPVDEATAGLAPDDAMRAAMNQKMTDLRGQLPEVLFVAFPGDEKTSGGCLAAGRGFFHINAKGGAEPCPFSPYSDTSLKEVSLRDALKSKLFRALQENGSLTEKHVGGCVLFEQKEQVEKLLAREII